MHFSLVYITDWLVQYGYFAIVPFVMLEGPIVTVISGYLCSIGVFNILIVYFVIVAADLTADCIYYAFGRFGKLTFLAHYGKCIGIDPARAIELEKHFEKNGGKTLFLGKISHGVGAIFLIAAGLAGMPFWRFVWYNLLATLIKSLILLLIGYFFGQAMLKINSFLQIFTVVSICVLVACVIIYLKYYSGKSKNVSK
ncbi:MAG: DedA family protein [bacterium]